MNCGDEGLTDPLQSIFTNNVKPIKTLNITFVLLVCEQKKISSVIEKIKLIPTVFDVRQVEGCYDVVCLEAESPHAINHTAEKIRLIDGIRTCITLQGGARPHHSVRRL